MANAREKREARRTSAQQWAKEQNSGFESTCVKLLEGFEFYKPAPGRHKIDFMPYVAGKYNKRADEGMEHFEFEYEAHRIQIADRGQLYTCRQRVFKKTCAVCDWLRKHGATADAELVKSLKATTRHLWIINDKPGETDNPLKIWDTNHYNRKQGFGEMMVEAIQGIEEYGDFWLLKGGYTVQITVVEDTFPGGKWNKVVRIDFMKRKYDYSETMIESCPCLDDCFVDPGYDSVKALLEGGVVGDDDDEPPTPPRDAPRRSVASLDDEDDDNGASTRKPSGAKANADSEDDEDSNGEEKEAFSKGDKVLYKGNECTVMKISNGTYHLEDEDGQDFRTQKVSDLSKVGAEEAPKKRTK